MWTTKNTEFGRIDAHHIAGQSGKALTASYTNPDFPDYEVFLEIVFQMERTEPGRLTFYPFFYFYVAYQGQRSPYASYTGEEYGPAGDSYEEATREMAKIYLERPVDLAYAEEVIADEFGSDEESEQELGDFLDALSAHVGADELRWLLEEAIHSGQLTEAQVRVLNPAEVSKFYRSIIGTAHSSFIAVLA